jgi:glucose-6-phosphate 1-epimerase
VDSADSTAIKLKPEQLASDGFDGAADLLLVVTIGHELTVQLVTENLGVNAFEFGGALHSYFEVEDINQTQLLGLSGDYLDKTQGYCRKITARDYRFHSETDRIHLGAISPQTITNGELSIGIESSGHDSIVVWNPWHEKSRAMTDMQENGYQSMLCVEAAITGSVTLGPSEQHTLMQIIR